MQTSMWCWHWGPHRDPGDPSLQEAPGRDPPQEEKMPSCGSVSGVVCSSRTVEAMGMAKRQHWEKYGQGKVGPDAGGAGTQETG